MLCYSIRACRGKAIDRVPLPPPLYGPASSGTSKPSRSRSSRPTAPSSDEHDVVGGTSQPPSSAFDNHVTERMLSFKYYCPFLKNFFNIFSFHPPLATD